MSTGPAWFGLADPDADEHDEAAIGDARTPQADGEVPFAERVLRQLGDGEISAADWRSHVVRWQTWACDCKVTARHYWHPGTAVTGEADVVPFDTPDLVVIAGPDGLSAECPSWRYVERSNVDGARPAPAKVKRADVAADVEVLAGPTEILTPATLPTAARPLWAHAARTLLTSVRFEPDGEPVACFGMVGRCVVDGRSTKWWARWEGGSFKAGFWDGWPVGARTLRARIEGRPDPVSKPRAPRKAAAPKASPGRRDVFLA